MHGDEPSGQVYVHDGQLVISDHSTGQQILVSGQSAENVSETDMVVSGSDNAVNASQLEDSQVVNDDSQNEVIDNDSSQVIESVVTQEATEEC